MSELQCQTHCDKSQSLEVKSLQVILVDTSSTLKARNLNMSSGGVDL